MNQYRLLSFNIRTQTTYDKDQQFIYRVDFLCDTIRALQADVIGLQEMTPLMRGLMIERLPEFVFLGGGRDKERLGESAGIAVRQSRFLIERVYSEMLSPTPAGGGRPGLPLHEHPHRPRGQERPPPGDGAADARLRGAAGPAAPAHSHHR